ncbi:MAG: putative peptidoglycan glycosyltransferase FtsW [bacterium]|nr:putative peptidoglycan glycosyltransferase FtsW [bacterium]
MNFLNLKSKSGKAADPFFISLVIFLVIFGLVMLASASSELGKNEFDDSYYFLKHQILFGLSLGLIGFFLGYSVYYRFWAKLAPWLLLLNILLLILVFVPGVGTNLGTGSERWLSIGSYSFQPSEFLKLTFLIYLAAWLGKDRQRRSSKFLVGFLPFLVICGVTAILLFLQPSTTIALLIIGSGTITYFMAGAKIRFLAIAGLFAVLAMALLVISTPYRLNRVKAFFASNNLFNIAIDLDGKNYHVEQALIAIGVGEWTGVGYGESAAKVSLLPEPIGDSIFAVIAEELGFIGSMFLITLFFLFVWRGLLIAKKTREPFGQLLVIGFSSIIGLQAFVHISAISGILPPTGVPLPFISYGGTALLTAMTMSGIIANVSKYRN